MRLQAVPFALLLVLAGAAIRPAVAQNPTLTLKLDNVTGHEAIAALSKAAGISIEPYTARFPAGVQVPGGPLGERASFDWNQVTLAAALRQLCERYQLRPSRRSDEGYVLNPGPRGGADPVPARPAGLVEQNGMRLYPTSISVSESAQRQINLLTGKVDGSRRDGNLNLALQGLILGGKVDAETIAGVDNAVARDDLGNILVDRWGGRFGVLAGRLGVGGRESFPDEWGASLALSAPDPKAKQLDWVEGDVMVYKRFRRQRVEFPLPAKEGDLRRAAGEAVVQLTRLDPGDDQRGPSLELEATVPAEAGLQFGGSPVLVGASGRRYTPSGGGGGSSGTGQGVTQLRTRGSFRTIDEPLVKVVVTLLERSEPEKLFRFRMERLPLPDPNLIPAPDPQPRRLVPPVEPPARLGARPMGRPYYQQGGGVLALSVRVADRPAPEGTLAVGLARKVGDGWEGIRWWNVDLAKDGQARLEDLQPGTYRLLRVYRPTADLQLPGPGRWQDGELEIEVVAGKELAVRPLAWTPLAKP